MFLQNLHGPYTYVIIFQVLVISVLMLLLLWFVVKRMLKRDAMAGAVAGANTNFVNLDLPESSATEPPVQVPPVEALAPEPKEPVLQVVPDPPKPEPASVPVPDSKPSVSQGSTADTTPETIQPQQSTTINHVTTQMISESESALQEKVRYLESKLLEYEILEEEISTLKGLKEENEELKQRLDGLKTKMGGEPASPTHVGNEPKAVSETAPAESLQPEPSVTIAEPAEDTVPEPKMVPEPPKQEASKPPAAAPKQETAAKAPETAKPTKKTSPAPKKEVDASIPKDGEAEGRAGSDVLAGILDQLDSLTKKD